MVLESVLVTIWVWSILSDRTWLSNNCRTLVQDTQNERMMSGKGVFHDYAEQRLIHLKQGLIENMENENPKCSKKPLIELPFVSNHNLREDFVSWVQDTGSENKLLVIGGSLTSGNWINGLPTKISETLIYYL